MQCVASHAFHIWAAAAFPCRPQDDALVLLQLQANASRQSSIGQQDLATKTIEPETIAEPDAWTSLLAIATERSVSDTNRSAATGRAAGEHKVIRYYVPKPSKRPLPKLNARQKAALADALNEESSDRENIWPEGKEQEYQKWMLIGVGSVFGLAIGISCCSSRCPVRRRTSQRKPSAASLLEESSASTGRDAGTRSAHLVPSIADQFKALRAASRGEPLPPTAGASADPGAPSKAASNESHSEKWSGSGHESDPSEGSVGAPYLVGDDDSSDSGSDLADDSSCFLGSNGGGGEVEYQDLVADGVDCRGLPFLREDGFVNDDEHIEVHDPDGPQGAAAEERFSEADDCSQFEDVEDTCINVTGAAASACASALAMDTTHARASAVEARHSGSEDADEDAEDDYVAEMSSACAENLSVCNLSLCNQSVLSERFHSLPSSEADADSPRSTCSQAINERRR